MVEEADSSQVKFAAQLAGGFSGKFPRRGTSDAKGETRVLRLRPKLFSELIVECYGDAISLCVEVK